MVDNWKRLTVIVMVGGCVSSPRLQPHPPRVQITHQLYDNLALLYQEFEDREFYLCIQGRVENSGPVLMDFRMPWHKLSERKRVELHREGNCEQYDGVVGELHNHRESCYLSRQDMHNWNNHEYSFQFVLCGERELAWWSKEEHSFRMTQTTKQPGQGYSEENPPILLNKRNESARHEIQDR